MFQNGELKENKRMGTARIRPSTASLFLIPSGAKAAKSRHLYGSLGAVKHENKRVRSNQFTLSRLKKSAK